MFFFSIDIVAVTDAQNDEESANVETPKKTKKVVKKNKPKESSEDEEVFIFWINELANVRSK